MGQLDSKFTDARKKSTAGRSSRGRAGEAVRAHGVVAISRKSRTRLNDRLARDGEGGTDGAASRSEERYRSSLDGVPPTPPGHGSFSKQSNEMDLEYVYGGARARRSQPDHSFLASTSHNYVYRPTRVAEPYLNQNLADLRLPPRSRGTAAGSPNKAARDAKRLARSRRRSPAAIYNYCYGQGNPAKPANQKMA